MSASAHFDARPVRPAFPSRVVIGGDSELCSHALDMLRGVADSLECVSSIEEVQLISRRDEYERLLVVVSPPVGHEKTTGRFIAAFRRREPLAQVVAYFGARRRWGVEATTPVRSGCDAIVVDGHDGRQTIREEVANRLKHILPAYVSHLLRPRGRSFERLFEGWCVRNSYRPLHVKSAGDYFGASRKTLYRSARHAGWESAEMLLRWARLLNVAVEIEQSSATAEAISRHLHFGSGAALHKLIKRTTGATFSQMRENGALAIAAALYTNRVRHDKTPTEIVGEPNNIRVDRLSQSE